jgi:hypothetical protein
MRRLSILAAVSLLMFGCAAETPDGEAESPPPESTAVETAETQRVDPDVHLSAHPDNVLDVAQFVKRRLRAPADALVPGAVRCDDPVQGTWVSREYFPEYGDWYRFELSVQRATDGSLSGAIRSRSWSGTNEDATPPACAEAAGEEESEGSFDWSVRMTASGRLDGASFELAGEHDVELEASRCGPSEVGARYNPDHFTGHLLDDGMRLVAVNNDGGRSANELHLFHRVSCR